MQGIFGRFSDVPEETRKEVARDVADKILEKLREEYAAR